MFSLFSKKRTEDITQPTVSQTDLHSHLIPAIDDGAISIDASLYMVRGLQRLGYRRCITTPHIYKGVHDNSKEEILTAFEQLQNALINHHIAFQMEVAAEYFFDEQFFHLADAGELLTFGNNYVLFELPFTVKPLMLDDIIFKLSLAGYRPLLAHPERYTYFHDRKMKEYEQLKNAGVLFQLNLMSLTGYYGSTQKAAASRLIDAGMIEFAGTDLHREKQLEVVDKALHTREYARLFNSGKLMNDTL